MNVAKLLIVIGLSVAAVGALILVADRLGLPRPGRLPGDLTWRGEGFTVYVPVATCLLLSVLLTLVYSLFRR